MQTNTKRVIALIALAMLVFQTTGLVSANHEGLTGLEDQDGWVDVHGDTMHGDLVFQDSDLILEGGAVHFLEEHGTSSSLRSLNGTLLFDGRRVCMGNLIQQGCGTITGVTGGEGLLGGATEGSVALGVDLEAVQARVTQACGEGYFIQGVQPDGTPDCAQAAPDTLESMRCSTDQVVAWDGAAWVCQDQGIPSLNSLEGLPCEFSGVDGEFELTFSPVGEISMRCETGIDYDSDPDHCGGAGQAVPQVPNAVTGCVDGEAVILECTSGFFDLDGEFDNGCEAEPVCEDGDFSIFQGEICEEGQWVEGCPDGFDLLSGACVDISVSRANCGAAGFSVREGEACVDGTAHDCTWPEDYDAETCSLAMDPDCFEGHTDGGDPCLQYTGCPVGWTEHDGACFDLESDPENCGSLGNGPPSAPNVKTWGCEGGQHAILECEEGWVDEDDDVSNGCEMEEASSGG